MIRSNIFPVALLATLAFACGGESAEEDTGEGSALTSSKVPAAADRESFRPVVSFSGHCTATKVGPRHFLTAAHCVVSPQGVMRPGSEIAFEMSNYQDVVIKRVERQRWPYVEKVVVDEDWLTTCRDARYRSNCKDVDFAKEAKAPDLALIVVKDVAAPPAREVNHSVTDMPQLPVLARGLTSGEPVTLAGYGCTGEVDNVRAFYKVYELRVSTTNVLDASRAAKPIADDHRLLGDQIFLSDAKTSLCAGDSGGPVLVKPNGSNRFAVAGIHAGFTVDPAGKVMANWHTRVDAGAKFRLPSGEVTIQKMLADEGVEVLP